MPLTGVRVCSTHLQEGLPVALRVGVQSVHQLLAGGLDEVGGQRKVPDGRVCRLLQVQSVAA